MADLNIRKEGRAGRITLTRAKALNALNDEMCAGIEAALDDWIDDDEVAHIVIDGEGDRAFCAGGDIALMYETGRVGDHGVSRKFFADEYRMNAKIFYYPKPVVSFMHGFTMGGGVGIAGHGSHRIVCDSTQIAMPECGIGLIPDVGGSLILARAPGRVGEYLGLTGARMGAGDAIYAGFADHYVPQEGWADLIAKLCDGDLAAVEAAAQPAPEAPLSAQREQIDALFAGETLGDIMRALPADPDDFTAAAIKAIGRGSPLSLACTLEIVRRVRGGDTILFALAQEYRFTFRATEHSDFLEGVRAAVIDKDRSPKWKHASWEDLPPSEVLAMTMPLGPDSLKLEEHFA